MDRDSLVTFMAIADEGSFAAAAQQLHITQPAVSKRIQQLELQLGVKLFDRVGRKVLLTSSGELLLDRARKLVHEMDDLKHRLQRQHHHISGHLHIATSHHIGIWRLPPFLREFSQRYNTVTLDLQFVDSLNACQLLEQGKVELALVTLDQPLPADLIDVPLWRDPLCVVVAAETADSALPDSLISLAETPSVLPDTSTVTGQLIRQRFADQGLQLQPVTSTNYLETLKTLAATGLGWSLLPVTMVDDSLRILDLPELQLERQLGLLLHQRRTLSPAGEAFVNLLRGYPHRALRESPG